MAEGGYKHLKIKHGSRKIVIPYRSHDDFIERCKRRFDIGKNEDVIFMLPDDDAELDPDCFIDFPNNQTLQMNVAAKERKSKVVQIQGLSTIASRTDRLSIYQTSEDTDIVSISDDINKGSDCYDESSYATGSEEYSENSPQIQWYKWGNCDWMRREQADMAMWTSSPIQKSLLNLDNPELNKLAVQCFICTLKFMGDYPMSSNENEIDCALKLLKACHRNPELRDEIYCHLCKQTTNNRSRTPKSCIMGWRLFGIITAWYDCSEAFKPYLFKYIETVASDTMRTYHGIASICLQNLRKTFQYGGRKNVPLTEEVNDLVNGRIEKEFIFIYRRLEREEMLQIKSCTVANDCVEDICQRLGIVDKAESGEYFVFIRTRDGQWSRLRHEEYLRDVTAEFVRNRRDYDIVFERTTWYFPLRSSDNILYSEFMYSLCLPDYINGLLVPTRDGCLDKQYEMDIQLLAAFIHRTSNHGDMPTLRDLDSLLPEIVRVLPGYNSQQWIKRVHEQMQTLNKYTPSQCLTLFVEILSHWPLFGSIFFNVKKVLSTPVHGECILAVNKTGIVFLDLRSHNIFLQFSFGEALSTKRYRSDSNKNYLDLKLGNLMRQKIVRIETEQGSDISFLIGQYMQLINRDQK